jgi:hypothetical protein
MRTFLAIFCLLSVAALRAADITDNDSISWNVQTIRGTYDWHVSAKRLLQTPEWNPETEPIPLAPDRACRLAGDWLRKHGFADFILERVQILRYDRTSLSPQGKQLAKRFYYRLEYMKPPEAMHVYVLLDGTVPEPKISAPPPRKK